MKRLLPLFMLMIAGHVTASPDIEAIMARANEAYDNENYKLAKAGYDSILQMGKESAKLYYNIGNACFKQNNLGKAILYYERAKLLAPNDKRIQHNLEFAQNKQKDEIETMPTLLPVRWWKQTSQMFSLNTWAKITLTITLITSLLWSAFILTKNLPMKNILRYPAILSAFILIMVLTITLRNMKYQSMKKHAIVLEPVVTAKASPASNSKDLFIIHEGLKVRILNKVNQWYEVRLADGTVGWLHEDAAEEI